MATKQTEWQVVGAGFAKADGEKGKMKDKLVGLIEKTFKSKDAANEDSPQRTEFLRAYFVGCGVDAALVEKKASKDGDYDTYRRGMANWYGAVNAVWKPKKATGTRKRKEDEKDAPSEVTAVYVRDILEPAFGDETDLIAWLSDQVDPVYQQCIDAIKAIKAETEKPAKKTTTPIKLAA